ncbi:dipeptidylpeptidase [Homalodisca vitripennis]|nr:dipeptidylpeptidase [Homalodisca vitripennis]
MVFNSYIIYKLNTDKPLTRSRREDLFCTLHLNSSLRATVVVVATQLPSIPEIEIHPPELFTHQLHSGEVVYAMIFRPHNFSPTAKYPVLLNVYGGPEVQLVSNTFKGMRHLRLHMLAAQGYCVIAIDSRGSHHRGLKFESHLKGRMDKKLKTLHEASKQGASQGSNARQPEG